MSAVEEQYDQWYRAAHGRFSDGPNASMAMPFYSRLRTHVLKLALIFEVAKSGSLLVSEDAMRKAIEIASQIEETVFELVKTGISHEGSEVNKMLVFVRSRGVAGATQSELTKNFYSVPEWERKPRLQTIVDSGDVTPFQRINTGGRPGLVYVFKDFIAQHKEQYPDDKAF